MEGCNSDCTVCTGGSHTSVYPSPGFLYSASTFDGACSGPYTYTSTSGTETRSNILGSLTTTSSDFFAVFAGCAPAPLPPPPSPPSLLTSQISCDFASDCAHATLSGVATRVSTYVRLTPNSGGQNGYVVFDSPPLASISELTISMQTYISSANGADGIGVYFADYASHNAAVGWDGAGLAGAGFAWAISAYYDRSRVAQRAVGATSGSILSQRSISSSEMTSLTGSSWKQVIITYAAGAISVTMAGIVLHDSISLSTIDPSTAAAWRLFIGARTGGVSNEHGVDSVVITYKGPVPAPPETPPPPTPPSLPPQ